MLDYLYTLDVPTLEDFQKAKSAYIIGDKYNLPVLKARGCQIMVEKLVQSFDSYYTRPEEDKTQLLSIIEYVWTWTYSDMEQFQAAILKGLNSKSSSNVEDKQFQDFMWQNKEFGIRFIRSAVAKKEELSGLHNPTAPAPVNVAAGGYKRRKRGGWNGY